MTHSSPRKPTWCLFFKEIRHSLWRGGATALAFCRGEDVFFRFLTHSQVDKSPDFQLTLTSGVRILSKGFALLDNNTTTLPQKLWKKANSGMSTKCLYLLRSISVEIQPRNSGFKIAHWRGDLTSKRTCLVPKRCFKRIILDVYVQVTTISLRYSYSLRIPFVYKNYIYSTGDVI